ncbi:MAG: hypothetical protein WD076_06000, partial [Parvularculaceae bacterium]
MFKAESAQLLPVAPFDLIVFGAAGDLAMRKLVPSLYHRWKDGQIPADSRIIGAARTAMESKAYRALAFENFRKFHPKEPIDGAAWRLFSERLSYVEFDVMGNSSNWAALRDALGSANGKQRVFYLALPPGLYGEACRNIDAAGVKTPGARIVLEKPIGNDLTSAREINDAVGAVFDPFNFIFPGAKGLRAMAVKGLTNAKYAPIMLRMGSFPSTIRTIVGKTAGLADDLAGGV